MKALTFALLVWLAFPARAEITVQALRQDELLAPEVFFHQLASAPYVVLGEKHHTPWIQQAQAWIVEGVVHAARRENDFTLGWEFLARSRKAETDALYGRFVKGEINAEEFLLSTQGPKSMSYAPILDSLRRLGGALFGVNLTREEKAPVVSGGLAALDPALVPPTFHLGGAHYFERFRAAMGEGHGDKLGNYFVAQCLTDAWMAQTLVADASHPLRFLVNGHFHSDYRDGVVKELEQRGAGAAIGVVTFLDASSLTPEAIHKALYHPRYGAVADYAVIRR